MTNICSNVPSETSKDMSSAACSNIQINRTQKLLRDQNMLLGLYKNDHFSYLVLRFYSADDGMKQTRKSNENLAAQTRVYHWYKLRII